jgi:hypothetical protein
MRGSSFWFQQRQAQRASILERLTPAIRKIYAAGFEVSLLAMKQSLFMWLRFPISTENISHPGLAHNGKGLLGRNCRRRPRLYYSDRIGAEISRANEQIHLGDDGNIFNSSHFTNEMVERAHKGQTRKRWWP